MQPLQMNLYRLQSDSEIEFLRAVRNGVLLVACRVCGQCHQKNGTHLYDYEGTVDDDLICHLCFQ
jgi:ligand of Numb protein X 1/2